VPTILFTDSLRDIVPIKPYEAQGCATVRAALERVFSEYPMLRSRLFDEQGVVRPRVAVFLDGQLVQDPDYLSDRVGPISQIHIMPALADRIVLRCHVPSTECSKLE
jgi:hypothetical protein